MAIGFPAFAPIIGRAKTPIVEKRGYRFTLASRDNPSLRRMTDRGEFRTLRRSNFGHALQHREHPMVLVTVIMALATAAFYGASNYGIGADQLCHYGGTFCVHPHWLGIPTLLLTIWTLFLRVDRI